MSKLILSFAIWFGSYYLIVNSDWDVGNKMLIFAAINSIGDSILRSLK